MGRLNGLLLVRWYSVRANIKYTRNLGMQSDPIIRPCAELVPGHGRTHLTK